MRFVKPLDSELVFRLATTHELIVTVEENVALPLYYQGVQFGYNFKNAGGLPLTVYAGFDTLKYNSGIGNPFSPFDTVSGTLPGYSAHAGVEFQPTPNVSLSLGFGYVQQSGRIDSDINSLSLPGASPFAVSGRR